MAHNDTTTDNEVWKTLQEYPNYRVSSLGNIRHINANKNRELYKTKKGYLQVSVNVGGNKGKSIYIHTLIAKAFLPNPKGLPVIDHINRDKQDNRVENLRWSSIALNTHNTTKEGNYTSKYKGVYKDAKTNQYVCRSNFKGVKVYLGRFEIEEDAARAYNKKAIEVYGEDALLNDV